MSKIQFKAALPSTTAIKIDGQDGSARITLETDSTQLHEILKLVLFSGMVFNVTIEE